MDDEIEHALHINRNVKVYRIPPRPASTGHISGDWRVADQIFEGRLRVLVRGCCAEVRLEDGSTGELFAVCPFTSDTQAVAVEPAVDSSRNFVLRVEDPATRRHAFLGLGFAERGEAFDFNAALDDHARQCQRDRILAQAPAAAVAAGGGSSSSGGSSSMAAAAGPPAGIDPALAALYRDPGDLSLKEGQTLRIDVHHTSHKPGGFLSRAAGSSGSFGAQLPGPPAGRSSGGGGGSKGLLPPPILPLPPLPQQTSTGGVLSPTAALPAGPAAVTVAASEENWAKFD